MNNEFTERMAQRTDAELIEIVTIKKDGYMPEALLAAETEIQKRNLTVNTIQEYTNSALEESTKAFNLELRKVSSATRFLIFLIDTVCYILLLFLLMIIGGIFISIFPISENALNILSYVIVLVSMVAYYTIMEGFWQKTVGKFITKTSVVTTLGDRPSFGVIFKRTLCRFIPFDYLTFVFMKNGIHDKFSGTIVVQDLKIKNRTFKDGQDLKRY